MGLNINLDFFFNSKQDINSEESYKKNLEKCLDASDHLIEEIKNGSNKIISSFSIEYQNKIKSKRNLLKNKKNKLVIGIGGSSAGAKAINSYLQGNIFFFDNYDPRHLNEFFKNHDLNDFTVYVVSKSGNTFETLALLNLTYQHMLKISNESEIKKNMIFVVENEDNLLKNFAQKKGIKIIEHNKEIGGRFSVFSETALLLFNFEPSIVSKRPSYVIDQLLEKKINCNSPITNAAVIMTLQEKDKIKFNVNVIYNYLLKNYSYWFHQLFAETLGKNDFAITPLTSICPKDHHSMMQLYLGGPKNKFFNVFPPENVFDLNSFSNLGLGIIENYTPATLLNLQFQALISTFKEKKIPHRILSFSENFENKVENLFELFAYNICETLILAYAQKINPYNQPDVELIKKKTFSF